jgi:hypothetical protein
MSRRCQPIDDRIHNVMVRREKFAAGCTDFDSHPVIGRDERPPCLPYVRLTSRGEDEPIDHLTHDPRVRLVIFDRARIMHRIHDRWSGRRLRRLRQPGSDGAKQNDSYVSHQQGGFVVATDFMNNRANHNCSTERHPVRSEGPRLRSLQHARQEGRIQTFCERFLAPLGMTPGKMT